MEFKTFCAKVLCHFVRLENGSRTDKDRLPFLVALLHFFDDSRIFLVLRFIDYILLVHTNFWSVRWNLDDFHAVHLAELFFLCFRCAGHSCHRRVHSEVVLNSDLGLRFVFFSR